MLHISERGKKILFIAFFVVFTTGAGYGLYYFFFKPKAEQIAVETPTGAGGSLQGAGQRTEEPQTLPAGGGSLGENVDYGGTGAAGAQTDVNLLKDSVTQSLSLNNSGASRFYTPDDGKFYKMNPDGTVTTLSDKQFFNVQTVDWAKATNEAILEFPDGSNIYYNFDDQRQTSLPQHWQDFEFSPQGSQIEAKSMGMDQNNRFLVTANADGNEATAIYHLGDNGNLVIPSWSPSGQIVGFSKTGSPQPDGAEEIILLGKNHENFTNLNVPGRGFMPSWSPTGKQLLYSVYHERDQLKPMLWITDMTPNEIGQSRRKLNINTWADKCVWASEQKLYCAVPVALPPGAGYSEKDFSNVPDDIFLVDLSTGISKKISTPDQNHPVSSPQLSADKKALLFTDSETGRFYSYKLKD